MTDRSRTLQLAIIVAGILGFALLLDRIIRATGNLASQTVNATADTMRAAVVDVVQAAVPTELVPQPEVESYEEQMSRLEAWAAGDTDTDVDGASPDWTEDGDDEAGVLTFTNADLMGAGGGALTPPPDLMGEL